MMGLKMKISLTDIIKEHLDTFRKSDGRFLVVDLMIFLFIPIALTVLIFIFVFKEIPEKFVDSLLISFSILTPLLFGLLPMSFSLIDNDYVSSKGFELVNEFKANVLFTILLSLLLVLLLLIWFLTVNWKCIMDIVICWLFIEILLHLFLILNRFNDLINEYIKLKKRHKNT